MATKNPNENFTWLTVEEAKEKLEKEEAQAVDVRPPSSWAGAHVPKAMNLPVISLQARSREIPTDKDILFVDEDGGATVVKAGEAGSKLELKEVFSIEGGMNAWLAAGYDTETIS